MKIPKLKPPMVIRIAPRRRPSAIARVEAATVTLTRLGGRGVLVPGGYILTAAHCISWTASSVMTMGPDDFREPIKTADRRKLVVAVRAVEPVADVAILGPVDGQRSPELTEAFEAFCNDTQAVPLYRGRLKPFVDMLAVLIYNKDKRWIQSDARIFDEGQPQFGFETAVEIKGGASGGPIITPAGELVGLVSNSTTAALGGVRKYDGIGVWPLKSLPIRFVDAISERSGDR